MRPTSTRLLRREQRHAWRGMKRGRHAKPARQQKPQAIAAPPVAVPVAVTP